jgi:ABC-2 type transport system permease protein
LVPRGVEWVARLTPSGALTEALTRALTLSVDWLGLGVLAIWGIVAALGARRCFRFT